MNKFNFTPISGLLDTSAYPTNPATEQEARGQIQDPLNQIKNYINSFADLFEMVKSPNGKWKHPEGLILQWGTVDITGQAPNAWNTGWSIEYPTPFPAAVVYVNPRVVFDGNSHDADLRVNPYLTENASKFMYHCKVGANGTLKFKWFAVGY